MLIEDARAVAAAFFVHPDDRIVKTREERARNRVLVTSTIGEVWVREREMIGERRPTGYRLFEAAEHASTYPPLLPHGIARLPDGRMFLLDREDDLRAFVAALGGPLDPVELAALVITYQGGHGQAPAPQLLMTAEDLVSLIDDGQLEAVTELIPFQPTRRDDGCLTLDFCALRREKSRMPIVAPMEVMRWHVETGGPRGLEWSFRIIAKGLRRRRVE